MTKVRAVGVLIPLAMILSAGAARTGSSMQRPDSTSIEDAVLAVSAEMTKAGEAGDADRLFSYILENDKGCVIQNGVFMATRQEALELVRNNLGRSPATVQYDWKRQYVTVLSPEVAVLAADGEVTVTRTSGESITTPLAQTIVFVLRDGKWKVIHAHQSTPPAR